MKKRTALTWINWIALVPAFLITRYANENKPNDVLFIIGMFLYLIAITAGVWNMVLMWKGDNRTWKRFPKKVKVKTIKKDDNGRYKTGISGDYET